MQCVIPGGNVKILARAIHALAKIGDDIYIHPKKDSLSFRTVNGPNSAYADFTFFDGYFSYYIYEGLDEEEALKCKISTRSALVVFKTPNLLDKQVETCHIMLKSDAPDISFILKFKNSIAKKYLLPILDSDVLQANYSKNQTVNEVESEARVLVDAVQNFQQSVTEITLEASSQRMLLRNYVDDVLGVPNTRTQFALSVEEFTRYVIGTDTTITFLMKELRAILNFAELVNVPISIHFESPGRPIIFILKSQNFEANTVLSTLNPDVESQSDTTLSSKLDKHTKTRANKRTPRTSKKTVNRRKNQSVKGKTLQNNRSKNLHPALVDSQSNAESSSSQGRLTALINELDQNDIEKNGDDPQEIKMKSPNMENRASNSNYTSKSRMLLNNEKELVNSIFSTITKRKSIDQSQDEQREERLDDTVPNSPPATPPSKKARVIFQKCFQTTFDPKMLPGHDIILAEDSDENYSD